MHHYQQKIIKLFEKNSFFKKLCYKNSITCVNKMRYIVEALDLHSQNKHITKAF